MEDKLKKLKDMMLPNYDWDKHWDDIKSDTFDALFRKSFSVITTSDKDLCGFECVGFKVEDTPKALYRVLYLGLPSNVDFSDMYKTGMLFGFKSECGCFFATVSLFKYEVNIYCYCKNREDVGGQAYGIQGGWASCNNGIYCSSIIGKLWFEVLKTALEFEHDVYPGNEFKV